jgi:hypothetical protein
MICGDVIDFTFNKNLINFVCSNTNIKVTPNINGITFHRMFEYNEKTKFSRVHHYFINHNPDQIVFVSNKRVKYIFKILLHGVTMAGIYNLEDLITIKHSNANSEQLLKFDKSYFHTDYKTSSCSCDLGQLSQIIKTDKRVQLIFFNNVNIDIETIMGDNLVVNFVVSDLKHVAYYYTMDIGDSITVVLVDNENREYTISASKRINIQMYGNAEYIYRVFPRT